jgi:hypothetical protein
MLQPPALNDKPSRAVAFRLAAANDRLFVQSLLGAVRLRASDSSSARAKARLLSNAPQLFSVGRLASDVRTSEQAAVSVEREEKPVFFPNFDEQARWRLSQDARGHHLGGGFIVRCFKCEGWGGGGTTVNVQAESSHSACMAVSILTPSDADVQRLFIAEDFWARAPHVKGQYKISSDSALRLIPVVSTSRSAGRRQHREMLGASACSASVPACVSVIRLAAQPALVASTAQDQSG